MREELSIHQTFRMYDDSGKENAIRFIAAHKGGIQMFSNPGELVAWAKTPEMIAYALRTKGADEIIMGSSSMDFATESGFYHNGAASHVLTLASNIAESGKTIAEYTKKKLTENVDIRDIEFGGLKKEEAEDWYTDGKVAFKS